MEIAAKRIWQWGLCGDFVEIYEKEAASAPTDWGPFFFVFRRKWQRKVVVLMCGLTKFGAMTAFKAFKEGSVDFTSLLELIVSKIDKEQIVIRRKAG